MDNDLLITSNTPPNQAVLLPKPVSDFHQTLLIFEGCFALNPFH